MLVLTFSLEELPSAFHARNTDDCSHRGSSCGSREKDSDGSGLAVMAVKKKGVASRPAPSRKRKPKQGEATPETPSVPLPETRDATRPPR